MSDVTRKIEFHETMGIDKRSPNLAYLRKNIFKAQTPGLYPARSFYQENPDHLTTQDIVDIVGSEKFLSISSFKIKVIVDDAGTCRFYHLGSNTERNTALTATDYECGTMGDDGVYACFDDDTCRKINHENSNLSSYGTFLEAIPEIAGFDGLYYWWLSRNEIYKQLSGASPAVAFNNIGMTPIFADFYNDQMVIFGQEGNDVVVLFWDKSDVDLFDKRLLIKNATLIAGGVVDGRVILVKSVGDHSNPKEFKGRIVVEMFDGEKFTEVNSIKAGDGDVEYVSVTSASVGSNRLIFSVENNADSANADLHKDFVYEVRGDGSIEVLEEPDTATYGDVHVVRAFYDFTLYAQRGISAGVPIIKINESFSTDFAEYFAEYDTSVYITEFLNNAYNLHKLDGMTLTFEKIFENTDDESDPVTGELLQIYYRVSERDSFTLIDTITAEKIATEVNTRRDQSVEYADSTKGLPQQRFDITKMSDGSPLPEYNEIQFKFVPKRGFSIINALYSYSYISRTTLN